MINNQHVKSFFKNNGPFEINKLLKEINFKTNSLYKNIKVEDIKDLASASKKILLFSFSKILWISI